MFFLKSVLSVFLFLLALIAAFTMFEVFGRDQRKFKAEGLKRLHRANGFVFTALFLFISYLCLRFIAQTGAAPTTRGVLHIMLALSVASLLALKIAYVRLYRQFYDQAKTIGVVVALMTVVMSGMTGGYYLFVSYFVNARASADVEDVSGGETESIARGKELYGSKCYSCHDPESTKTIVGPGHKGILKRKFLPVSGRPATPESVIEQMRRPIKDMPSFEYLSEEEASDIVSYMNTL